MHLRGLAGHGRWIGLGLAIVSAGLALSGCGGTEETASFRDCADCPEMVTIPAGSFEIGSPADEPGRESEEGPVTRITLAKPFALGKYEVTFEEWDRCVADGPCAGRGAYDEGWGRGRRPVVNVSWDDAEAFIGWLSARSGHGYRLPSEAEWEYAARGGNPAAYYSGDEPPFGRENFDERFDRDGPRDLDGDVRLATTPAGSFAPNPYGLYDILGNAREWVADCHRRNYDEIPTDGKPLSTGDCSTRSIRGGAWGLTAPLLRSAARWKQVPNFRLYTFGFRVARDLP